MPSSVEQLASRPLADIAEELFKLREESSALKEAQRVSQVEQATTLKELKDTVERLERKNARLLDTNGQFAAILEERWRAKIQRRGVQAASIPYDILLHIFENTQLGLHECEHSVVPEPRSRWLAGLRMEKALTLVCKGWACPATKLLYADIVLRRMGQITALAHTLRSQGPRSPLSVLVKSLRMDSCIVPESCADAVRSDLEFLLRECMNLLSFSFHPHPSFPFSPYHAQHSDGFNPSWILEPKHGDAGDLLAERLASGLFTLDIAVTLAGCHIYQVALMLAHGKSLRSLSLGRVTSLLPGASLPAIHLPALMTLQVYLDHEPFVMYIVEQWQMPRLTALTCRSNDAVPILLLATHGTKLTYLKFDDWWYALQDRPSLVRLLHQLCPVLENFVLPI